MATGRLAEKVTIVSGGAHGMGLQLTRALLEEGARVVAFDFDAAAGEALVADREPGCLTFVQGQVTSGEDWARAVKEAKSRFGVINALVNAAAISPPNRLENVSEAAYRRVIDVNQVGSFLGMQAVIPKMRDYGGSIVNVASTAAVTGAPGAFAYVTSGWAVRGMTKAAAQELADARIRVNVVCSSYVRAPAERGSGSGAGASAEPLAVAFARRAQPEDVSAAVVFLASDESSFISGVELVVDGAYLVG